MQYLLLVKVHFYQSVSMLYPKEMTSLEDRLISLVVQKGFKLRVSRDGYFLFSLDSRREQAEQILLDTAGVVEENLINEEEWLFGYSIVLEKAEERPSEELFFTLRNQSYRAMEEGRIWVGPALRSEKASAWNLSPGGTLSPLDRLALRQTTLVERASLYREHPAYPILSEHLIKRKKVRGPTLLVCPDIQALRFHVLDALKDQDLVFFLGRPGEHEEPFAHFLAELGDLFESSEVLNDGFSGGQWFQDACAIFANTLESLPAASVLYLVFDRFSEWGEEFHRFWESALKAVARHVRPVFLEGRVPTVKGLGDPIDLGELRLDSIWGPEGLLKALKGLDPLQKKILFLCALPRIQVRAKVLKSFLVKAGEDDGIVDDKIQSAITRGFLVRIRERLLPVNLPNEVWETLLFENREELGRTWLSYLLEKDSSLTLSQVIGILMLHGDRQRLLLVLRRYLRSLIHRRSESFDMVVNRPMFDRYFAESSATAQEWEVVKTASRMRHLLDWPPETGNLVAAVAALANVPIDEESAKGNSDWLCQISRLHHLKGNLDEAYASIRRAYALAQRAQDVDVEILAALEMGQILLKRKKLDEAAEYFNIAWREAEKNRLPLYEVHAALLTGVARFLIGNLKSCENAWRAAQDQAAKYYRHEHGTIASFLLGRLCFELGQYSRAMKHFEIASREYGSPARAWYARCLCYSGQSDQAVKMLEKEPATRETEFFLVEALYFSDRHPEALNVAHHWQPSEVQPVLWQGLRWDRTTGFSCLEDRCLESEKEQTVLERLSLAFRDFLVLWYEDPRSEESLQRFDRICSDKNLSLADPYTHQYFLWFSLVLGKGQAEKNARWSTLMGRGLKELQARGSKVDDRDDRVMFLNTPWWNALLLNEARKNKLL